LLIPRQIRYLFFQITLLLIVVPFRVRFVKIRPVGGIIID
jgi:hypothetical protein